jgi:hypothetical protein
MPVPVKLCSTTDESGRDRICARAVQPWVRSIALPEMTTAQRGDQNVSPILMSRSTLTAMK